MTEQNRTDVDQIAVLIDFENVALTTVQSLFKQLSNYGRIVLKRAYADWGSSAKNSRNQILELGIEPVQVFRSPSRRKNGCDIKITIDATELLLTSSIEAFVIISSDSDFVPLVNKLRSSGKKVYGAGDKSKAVDTLVISCDEYFEMEQSKHAQQGEEKSKTKGKNPPDTLKIEKIVQTPPKPQIDDMIAQQIDEAWFKRAPTTGASMPGPTAAEDLTTILNIEKLKDSTYKTLKGVIAANPLLTEHWRHHRNTIFRK